MMPETPARQANALGPEERMVLRTARTIFVAMIVGVLLFAGVVFGLSMSGRWSGNPVRPPSLANVPQMVLLIAGIAAALLVSAIPIVLLVRSRMRKQGVDPQTGRVELGTFMTSNILLVALLEMPAMLGLVSCVIGKSLWPGGVVAGLAVIMMIALIPRAADFTPRRTHDQDALGYREPEKWR